MLVDSVCKTCSSDDWNTKKLGKCDVLYSEYSLQDIIGYTNMFYETIH